MATIDCNVRSSIHGDRCEAMAPVWVRYLHGIPLLILKSELGYQTSLACSYVQSDIPTVDPREAFSIFFLKPLL